MTVPQRPVSVRAPIHPGAWWSWGILLAATAARTTNLSVLAMLVAVVITVVWACRVPSPQQRSLTLFIRLAIFVLVTRLVLQVIFAPRLPGTVLFRLPEATLPSWAAGIAVGGPVTAESLLSGAAAAGRLAAVLICVGAVSTMATPARVLRSLPAVLYEAGVAVTVALTATPQAVAEVGRIRNARLLRGRPTRGPAGLRGTAVPILEGALDRSITLAASMDARGYGRRDASGPHRRRSLMALVVGLISMCVGLYGLFSGDSLAGIGGPLLILGALICAVSMFLAGRGTRRTRYRPARWTQQSSIIAAAALAPLIATFVAQILDRDALIPSNNVLSVPPLPLPIVIGLALALTPMLIAPSTPSSFKVGQP